MPARPPAAVWAILLLLTLALAGCTAQRGDADGDGLPDDVEAQYGTDPEAADTDGDGLTDHDEVVTYGPLGLDPLKADTDGDGLDDFEEVVLYGTDATVADADQDGLSDHEEVTRFSGWECRQDGEPPRCERVWGLNTTQADTDDDRWPDGQETSYWMDRFDDDELAGRYAAAPDVDGDGVVDGLDIDPAHDLRVRFRVLEINLTRSFDGEGGANLTLGLLAGAGTRTEHVGRVGEGPTDLDVTWTHDLDDEGRPVDFDVTFAVSPLHDGDEAILLDGEAGSVVRTLRVSDPTITGTGTVTSTGDDGSLTYSVRICRGPC